MAIKMIADSVSVKYVKDGKEVSQDVPFQRPTDEGADMSDAIEYVKKYLTDEQQKSDNVQELCIALATKYLFARIRSNEAQNARTAFLSVIAGPDKAIEKAAQALFETRAAAGKPLDIEECRKRIRAQFDE